MCVCVCAFSGARTSCNSVTDWQQVHFPAPLALRGKCGQGIMMIDTIMPPSHLPPFHMMQNTYQRWHVYEIITHSSMFTLHLSLITDTEFRKSSHFLKPIIYCFNVNTYEILRYLQWIPTVGQKGTEMEGSSIFRARDASSTRETHHWSVVSTFLSVKKNSNTTICYSGSI